MVAFKDWRSRVSLADFSQIVFCAYQGVGKSYQTELNRLFWRGNEPFKATNRTEGFLALLPYTAYVDAYSFSTNNPPDPKWDFSKIVEEIHKYGANAKLVMLHVTYWYNIAVREPAPRLVIKDPIYHHLKMPFCEMLSQGLHEVTEQEWKAKAIALQQIVLDFMKSNYKMLRGPPVSGTLRFHPTTETGDYCKRFVSETFWDLLAREIRQKMPDLPFKHPDLQPYNIPGENLVNPFAAFLELEDELMNSHPSRRELCMGNLAAGEGGKVLEQTSSWIAEEYGSNTSSVGDYFDVESRASTEAPNESHSKESTNVHSESGRHGLQNADDDADDDAADDADNDADNDADDDVSTATLPQPSAQTYTTTSSLGKRKTSIIKPDPDSGEVDPLGHLPADAPWNTNHINHRPTKIIKLKFAPYKTTKTTTPKEPAPSDIAPRPSKTGKRDVDFFRDQVQLNSSPSKVVSQERSPSTLITATGLVSNQAADSTWRNGSQSSRNSPMLPIEKPSPIDPIPPPRRRRRMMTNLPPNIFSTPPPAAEASTTANLSFQSPASITTPLHRHLPQIYEVPSSSMPPTQEKDDEAGPESHDSESSSLLFKAQAPEASTTADLSSQSPAPVATLWHRHLSQLSGMSSSYTPPNQEKDDETGPEPHDSESSSLQFKSQAPEASQGPQTPQRPQAPPSRPRTPLSKLERAIELVLEDFSGRLTMTEKIAAINTVRNEAAIYLMLKPADLRKEWLLSEIGKRND